MQNRKYTIEEVRREGKYCSINHLEKEHLLEAMGLENFPVELKVNDWSKGEIVPAYDGPLMLDEAVLVCPRQLLPKARELLEGSGEQISVFKDGVLIGYYRYHFTYTAAPDFKTAFMWEILSSGGRHERWFSRYELDRRADLLEAVLRSAPIGNLEELKKFWSGVWGTALQFAISKEYGIAPTSDSYLCHKNGLWTIGMKLLHSIDQNGWMFVC